MLRKKPVSKSDKISVVFEIEGFDDAREISLVGDFNDWEPARTPMRRRKDGSWAATVRLPNDHRFEYKILVDGNTWLADQQADALVPDPFGNQNSVVILP